MLLDPHPMASIRRTLSPSFHDRPFLHRPPPLPSSSSSSLLRRLLAGVFPLKPPRKQPSWKLILIRFLLCFLLGFLLGLSPFADLDDTGLRPHNFSFDPLLSPPSQDNLDIASVIRPGGSRRADIEIATSESFASVELEAKKGEGEDGESGPAVPRKLLIMVTPTYNRALQAYYLNRLAQTVRLIPPPLLWVVVETNSASEETAEILRRSGVMYRHLVCYKQSRNPKDRGVLQRNTALKHIKHHRMDGIVYFADDDNTYSLELFEHMREIRRFGTWPVAMVAHSKSKATLEGPVCNGSQVVGWHTNEKSKRLRRFHIDMSGFAFNSTILWDPKRWHRPTKDPILQLDTVKEGFQETTFIEQLVEDERQMEGTPRGCSRIMNWHLHLDVGNLRHPRGWQVSKNLDVVLPLK